MDIRDEGVVLVDGAWVEQDALRIAERIHEYCSDLRVQYLDGLAKLGDPPFRVIEHCKDGKDRILLDAWKLDEFVFQRVVAADIHRTPDLGDLIIIKNAEVKKKVRKYKREQMAEDSRLAASVVTSPKDSYTFHHPISQQKLTIRSNGTVKRWT